MICKINTLQHEIKRKLTDDSNKLQTQKPQAPTSRAASVEKDLGELIVEMLEQTCQMQEKITILEGRSRRNNIPIFDVPDGR